MLAVLADRPDLAQVPAPRPLRIGVATNTPSPIVRLDGEWARGVEATAALLGAGGHHTVGTKVPYPPNMTAAFARWFAGTAADAAELDPALLQRRTRRHVAIGRVVERAGLVRASQVERLEARMRRFFDEHDVVLTPPSRNHRCPPSSGARSRGRPTSSQMYDMPRSVRSGTSSAGRPRVFRSVCTAGREHRSPCR